MISRAEYDALKGENAELNQKVDWLMEQLRLLRKKQFGASSQAGMTDPPSCSMSTSQTRRRSTRRSF